MIKVFVTGLGCVSASGMNVEEHLDAFRHEKAPLLSEERSRTGENYALARIPLSNDELKQRLSLSPSECITRTALLGMLAAREAYDDAGLTGRKNHKIAFISATSAGGMELTEQFYPAFQDNPQNGRLRLVKGHDAGDSTEQIAHLLHLTGFRTTISTACSSGANALMLAARLIRAGWYDTVIAGGSDALCRFTIEGFHSLHILDASPCKPFDAHRNGLNLGEGAAYLVLQSEKALSQTPYAELAGWGNANDAFHQTASSDEGIGATLAMAEALRTAHVQPVEIDYIHTHGTATLNNDLTESRAIKELFADHIPAFSSTKPFTGHTLGAAGAIGALFSVLTIREKILLPNLHFKVPMEETGWIPVRNVQHHEVKRVLSNAFGFGGNDSSLLFCKCELS